MSQNERILKHLKRGRRITPLQALNLFGCLHLASRICELKDRGHNIDTKMVKVKGKRVAEYRLVA